LTGNF